MVDLAAEEKRIKARLNDLTKRLSKRAFFPFLRHFVQIWRNDSASKIAFNITRNMTT